MLPLQDCGAVRGRRLPAAPARVSGQRSSGGDHQRDLRRDLTVELHVSSAGTHGLDRLLELDLAPVQRDPVLLLERRRHIGVGHGTKQLAILPAPQLQYHLHGLELDGQCLRLIQLALLALHRRGLGAIHLLLRALGRGLGQLARKQEVARVAVGHVFGLTGLSRAFHILGQDNLHAILRRERATARPRSRNSFNRPRSPSRLRRRSWSKTLVPSAIRSWCSATTSLGAFSTNKRIASTVTATASIPPKTGRRSGTSTTGFRINAIAAASASLLRCGTRGSR